MAKLYIDIDGVILTKRHPRPADGVAEFLAFIVNNFDCFWLTTHCKGNPQTAVNYLKPYFDPEIHQLFEQIKPTDWDALKTEGIDFESDFYWLDDAPLNVELERMKEKGKLDRFILVDLNREDELLVIHRNFILLDSDHDFLD